MERWGDIYLWEALTNKDVQARVLSVFITWSALRLLQAVLNAVMQYKLVPRETLLLGVRMALKIVRSVSWIIIFKVFYSRIWKQRKDVVFNLMSGDELLNTRGSLKSKFKDALNSLKLRYGLGGHLWYKIGKNEYRRCAVIEAFDNVRHLLLAIVHAALIKLVGLLVKPKKDFSNVVTSLQAIYEIAARDFFDDKRTMGELKMAGLAPNRLTSGIGLFFENAVELHNLKCTNCNKIGHTVERCYDIIGYPPGYMKKNNDFQGKTVSSSNSTSMSNLTNSTAASLSNPSMAFTNEQMIKLMSLLNEKSLPTANANMASTSFKGVNQHMTVSANFSINVVDVC
ncbi:hypothetical protein Tco_0673984 [Tanacetum coccineum]